MVLMQIRELNFCAHHKRGLIVLEDAQRSLTLAFDVHPDEVPRLSQIIKGANHIIHPRYDFVEPLLDAFLINPTDVVLDDVPQRGLMAFVYVERAGTRLSVPCYAPDALALAVQPLSDMAEMRFYAAAFCRDVCRHAARSRLPAL